MSKKEWADPKFYCLSCYEMTGKKYRMFKITDMFGEDALECGHCHYPILKDFWVRQYNTFDGNTLILAM